MPDKIKQLGVFQISYELLAELIGLDDSHRVVNIFHEEDEKKAQIIGVVVEGPEMFKTPEGNQLCWDWEVPQKDGTKKDIRDLKCLIK